MKVSNCCGENMNNEEGDVCPKCKEHCDIEDNQDMLLIRKKFKVNRTPYAEKLVDDVIKETERRCK